MSHSLLDIPQQQRYFDDYIPNSVYEFGKVTVDEAEIIDFAQRFDPQTFHIDTEAAKHTMFGGLIASGWHTAGITMRMLVDYYLPSNASLGSPGLEELNWRKPLRPGDQLSVRVTILDAKRSRSKPDRGIIRTRVETLNQNGEVVMDLTAVNFLLCR